MRIQLSLVLDSFRLDDPLDLFVAQERLNIMAIVLYALILDFEPIAKFLSSRWKYGIRCKQTVIVCRLLLCVKTY